MYSPLRRLRQTGTPAQGTPRARHPLSLLPFLIVGVLVLLAFHLVRLVVDVALANPPAPAYVPLAQAPTPLVVTKTSQTTNTPPLRLKQVSTPAYPHNLQFGNPQASHTFTIFTDPACLSCREKLNQWLAPITISHHRVVIKFWPENPDNLTPGLLMLAAQEAGIPSAYWNAINTMKSKENRLTDVQLFELYEQQHQSLPELRAKLAEKSANMMELLAKDLDLGRSLRLPPPPVIVLDNYLIDNANLYAERLPEYLNRLSTGAEITQFSDTYFAP